MAIGAVMVARNSPAVAYEPSIYTATPSIVWLVLFINVVCGIGIVVHQVYTKRHTEGYLWLLGLCLILLSYTTLLSLWIIRGYALWGDGDPLGHLNFVYGLISTGYINNIYPITHILLAQISQVCDISPRVFHNILPLVFGLSYPAFMYLLAKSILRQKGQIIMVILASTTFMLTASFLQLTPTRLANLALPLALFILIRSFTHGTIQWKVLLIIMIFLFPPFHPVPAFLFFFTLVTIWLVSALPVIKERKLSKRIDNSFKFNFTATVLLVVWAIFWFLPHPAWVEIIIGVKDPVLSPPDPHRSLYDLLFIYIAFWLNHFGAVLICITFAVAAVPILLKKIGLQPDLWKLVSLYGPMATAFFVIILLYFRDIGLNPLFTPVPRLLVYLVILGTLFIGFVLYELLERADQTRHHFRKVVPLMVIVFLVALFLFGTVRLYASPFTHDNNYQITRTQLAGMDWFLHKKDYAMPVGGILIPPGLLGGILLTPEEWRNRPHIHTPRGMIREELRLPSHLGYDRYPTMGDLFGTDIYLVLDERDRNLYCGPFHELSEFTFLPQDFERMNYDPTVNHIYSNGGFDAYFIHGANSS
jgi:hypothetical protein